MKLLNSLASMIKRNQTAILSSAAISGVATTAYLAARGAYKASFVLRDDAFRNDSIPDRKERLKHQAEMTWRFYIPAAASGVFTVVCIVTNAKVSNKRVMAAQAAFVLTERAYSEYRDKVVEEYGEKADEKIRTKIAEDQVRIKPPSNEVVVVVGQVLCCEQYTGRYFQSDMETLRKAQNDLNAMLISRDCASLEEWYYMIGLQPTDFSSDFGWNSDRMLELQFSSVLAEDGRPCLAFTYKNLRPLYEGILDN